ncbi:MAG: PQQ-binding-like beta-propeller repeat protein [Deltaproteobacteria bacterium]
MVDQQSAPPLVVISLTKRLVAMNAHTGQRVWEYETGNFDGRLFVDHGLVIYHNAAGILCLDYLTGALRWKSQPPPSLMGGLVLVYAGCVIISALGETACLNAQNGALLWHDPFKGYGSGTGPMAAPGVSAQIDRH